MASKAPSQNYDKKSNDDLYLQDRKTEGPSFPLNTSQQSWLYEAIWELLAGLKGGKAEEDVTTALNFISLLYSTISSHTQIVSLIATYLISFRSWSLQAINLNLVVVCP